VPLAGGLDGVDAGMIFGPGGLLWVPGFESDLIVALDPETGAVQQMLSGTSSPRSLWFDDLGRLWVTSWRENAMGSMADAAVARLRL
jgi:streptogramin lyase